MREEESNPHIGAVDRSLIIIKVVLLQLFSFVSHFLILLFQKNELGRNRIGCVMLETNIETFLDR